MSRADSARQCAASAWIRSPSRSVSPRAVGNNVARKTRVGVLALQGDFREHRAILGSLGVDAPEVRLPEQLDDLDALVIPGGESTTIGKLAAEYGLVQPLRARAAAGMPVWGTCAGAIFMARRVPGHTEPLAEIMDITVERNAFGRQIDSFEVEVDAPAVGRDPFPGVFIRAPRISAMGAGVETVAALTDGTVVAARQGSLLATSFHPELTRDARFHRYFLSFLGRPT